MRVNPPPPPPDFLWLQNKVRTALAAARFTFTGGITAYPVVDSGPFLVKLMAAYLEQEPDLEFLRGHLPRLTKALAAVPTEAATGLAWVDPAQPHTAYGFTDTIAKTGREFQAHGIWECVGPEGYNRLENNLSSMMLPYRSFMAMLHLGSGLHEHNAHRIRIGEGK